MIAVYLGEVTSGVRVMGAFINARSRIASAPLSAKDRRDPGRTRQEFAFTFQILVTIRERSPPPLSTRVPRSRCLHAHRSEHTCSRNISRMIILLRLIVAVTVPDTWCNHFHEGSLANNKKRTLTKLQERIGQFEQSFRLHQNYICSRQLNTKVRKRLITKNN